MDVDGREFRPRLEDERPHRSAALRDYAEAREYQFFPPLHLHLVHIGEVDDGGCERARRSELI